MNTSHTPGPLDFVGLQVFTQGRAEDEQEAGDLECAKIYGDLHSLACNAPKTAAERDRLRDALVTMKADYELLARNHADAWHNSEVLTHQAINTAAKAALAGTPGTETDRLRASNAELLAALQLDAASKLGVGKAIAIFRKHGFTGQANGSEMSVWVQAFKRTAIAKAEGRT